jgi:hypothetical protein
VYVRLGRCTQLYVAFWPCLPHTLFRVGRTGYLYVCVSYVLRFLGLRSSVLPSTYLNQSPISVLEFAPSSEVNAAILNS